jgi:DNA-binding transcriptional MerR regulator
LLSLSSFSGRVVYTETEVRAMGRNGKALVWPAEALKIIGKKADPVELCAELARVSNHDRRACWRFLKKHGVDRLTSHPRMRYKWPAEAESIALRKCNPAALCAELARLTGYNERACWNFLERRGVRRPGSTSRTSFSERLQERIVEYSTDHGIQACSMRFNLPRKAIYNLLYRQEMTSRSRDFFTMREVCRHLSVRESTVLTWIEAGLLTAEQSTRRDGRVFYAFNHEALTKFCKQSRELLLKRRWPERRLEFIREYIFAPKHADLLDSRECKRAREAQAEQERAEQLRAVNRTSPKTGRTVAAARSRNNGHAFDDCA